MKDLQSDPASLWGEIARRHDWREFIVPQRDEARFWAEGELEAANIRALADPFDDRFVIDYGCGVGRIAKAFKCQQILGLDVILWPVEDLPHGRYDTILYWDDDREVATFAYSIAVLQHNDTANCAKIVRHVHQLLVPGGKFVANFPAAGARAYATSDWFRHTFTEGNVRELLADFAEVRLVPGNLASYGGMELRPGETNEIFAVATKGAA